MAVRDCLIYFISFGGNQNVIQTCALCCVTIFRVLNGLKERDSLDNLVVDGRCHADGATREVGVEVLAIHELHARWRVTVGRQQVVDVVLAAVAGQSNEA